MVSQNFINHVIDNATKEDLQVFVKEVLKSVIFDNRWADNVINNALEIISGCANPFNTMSFNDKKIVEYIHDYAYKGKESNSYQVTYVDNFKAEVFVKYNSVHDGELDTETHIPFADVI